MQAEFLYQPSNSYPSWDGTAGVKEAVPSSLSARETVEGGVASAGMTEPIHWKFTSMEGIQRPYRVKSLPKASYTLS